MTVSITPVPTLKDNYVWVLINEENRSAVIVDPGEAKPVAAFLKQHKLRLESILITHHHWDHTNGISELKFTANCPVIAPVKEKVSNVTYPVYENDKVQIDNFPITFQVIDIPGHTLGHVAYFGNGKLFCGDTLFAAGCGRIFEGTAEQMYTSLKKLAALPPHTKIYCGHEYTLNNLNFANSVEPQNKKIAERIARVTEIRQKNLPSLPSLLTEELDTNPFFRCDSPEIIKNVETYAGKSLSNPVEVFSWLRKMKDNF